MNEEMYAKNLLLGKTCQTCLAQKTKEEDKDFCVRYLGEACGWQWWPQDKKIRARIGEMNKELEAAIAKNLLEDKTCNNCNNEYTCSIKLGKQFNTCRRWKKYENNFNIKSYNFKVKPRKLNITWTKETEDILLEMKDDDNYSVYKHLYDWKANIDALRELNDGKSCGNCLHRDDCIEKERGICNKHETIDAESLLIKQVGIELQKEIDKKINEEMKKNE